MVKGYTCWLLNLKDRERLMNRFPPAYPNVVAHHVTHTYGVTQDYPLPTSFYGEIMGEIIDKGVQALVVRLDRTTTRHDGETYHITWSLDEGRFPENSIPLVRRGWWPVRHPIWVELTPAFVASKPKY